MVNLTVVGEDGIKRRGLVDIAMSGNTVTTRDIRARWGLHETGFLRADGSKDGRR
jgi:hypothetical protein